MVVIHAASWWERVFESVEDVKYLVRTQVVGSPCRGPDECQGMSRNVPEDGHLNTELVRVSNSVAGLGKAVAVNTETAANRGEQNFGTLWTTRNTTRLIWFRIEGRVVTKEEAVGVSAE